MPLFNSDDLDIPISAMSNDTPMSADRTDKVVTEHAAYQSDLLTRRKAWVSGVLKNDAFIYSSKASTVSGSATFYITSDGTSGGSAVFSNVYADTVAVIPYGTSGSYQPSNVVVSGDKKSITVDVSQATNVLGLLTFNSTAANGIDCRLYVMGD